MTCRSYDFLYETLLRTLTYYASLLCREIYGVCVVTNYDYAMLM
jgi:hypothetical protein